MYEPQLSHLCIFYIVFRCIFYTVSFTRRVRIDGAGSGVLYATQLIGHTARLLYWDRGSY